MELKNLHSRVERTGDYRYFGRPLMAASLLSRALMDDSGAADRLPHGHVTEGIINAFFETSRELGHGFSEHVCRRAVAIVLRTNGFRVVEEVALEVHFRGSIIGTFRADLIVEDVVLVEVKTTPKLEPYSEAQLLNYLKAASGGVGMLLNFGRTAQFKRMVAGDPLNSLPLVKKPD